jgi:predicted nucleic acid-binding Zn ribbon protein
MRTASEACQEVLLHGQRKETTCQSLVQVTKIVIVLQVFLAKWVFHTEINTA